MNRIPPLINEPTPPPPPAIKKVESEEESVIEEAQLLKYVAALVTAPESAKLPVIVLCRITAITKEPETVRLPPTD